MSNYINTSIEDIKWKSLVPGIKQINLDIKSKKAGTVRLLNISPGKTILSHSHSGIEMSLILQGSYTDEKGHFSVGDAFDLDRETSHQPYIDSKENCIALIATEGPLIYEGALGKALQPFIGI